MPLLVVGQSHVAAFRAAARTHREAYPDEPRARTIHTLDEAHAPEFEGDRFGPRLRAAIEDQIARHAPRVVSVLGGNVHNMLALMRHPRPFDFLLSGGEAGPPLDPQAELVPESMVRAALEDRLATDFARLRALGMAAGGFIHVESPPPVRQEAFIRDRAEAYFRDTSGREIVPGSPGLRWRTWRLTSRILRERVKALGGCFMPVPRSVLDEEGFLRLDLAADPTHGNEAYGEALIRALEDLPG